jgi:hypothetical protein
MSPRACAGGASRGCSNPGSCSENGREGATRVDFLCVHRTSKKLATQTLPDARRESRAERGDRLRVTNATADFSLFEPNAATLRSAPPRGGRAAWRSPWPPRRPSPRPPRFAAVPDARTRACPPRCAVAHPHAASARFGEALFSFSASRR